MSEVQNFKCDVCGKVAAGNGGCYGSPTGWYDVSKTTKDKKDFWQHRKDICDECAESSGLVAALKVLSHGKTE